MQFVMFDEFKPGLLQNNRVVDISSLLDDQDPAKMVPAFIAGAQQIGREAEKLGDRATRPLAGVRLRQPVPDPAQLVCAARNYADGHEAPKADFFLKARGTIVGPGDQVVLPEAQATVFHAEPELAVVIKSRAVNVKAADAMEYVFGYTCFLDVSARGLSTGYYIHKSFATFGPMGPSIVTADEVPDPHALRIRLWVDDALRQDFSTGQMANRIDKLIEVASAVCPLEAGDVLATGTHHIGLGPIQDGQLVTMEIEKVGRLSVRIRDPLKRKWDATPKAH